MEPIKFKILLQIIHQMASERPKVFDELSKLLGLRYQAGNDNCNVCLVNSEEVRPEFREVFTSTDVVNYLFGLFHSSAGHQIVEKELPIAFPYPDDSKAFWQLVKSGLEIQLEQSNTQ